MSEAIGATAARTAAFVREQGRKAMRQTRLADGAEQTVKYITRSRHFGNDRYSTNARIFLTKVLKRGPVFRFRKLLKKRF